MIYWFGIGLLVWCYYMLFLKKGRDILGKVFWDINCEPASKEIAVTFSGIVIGFIGTIVLWPVSIYNNEFRKKYGSL